MSGMECNPYVTDEMARWTTGKPASPAMAQAQAKLALAYEQRTANLIAFLPYASQCANRDMQDQMLIGIARRLGAN